MDSETAREAAQTSSSPWIISRTLVFCRDVGRTSLSSRPDLDVNCVSRDRTAPVDRATATVGPIEGAGAWPLCYLRLSRAHERSAPEGGTSQRKCNGRVAAIPSTTNCVRLAERSLPQDQYRE